MFCPNCGFENIDTNVCRNCGEKLNLRSENLDSNEENNHINSNEQSTNYNGANGCNDSDNKKFNSCDEVNPYENPYSNRQYVTNQTSTYRSYQDQNQYNNQGHHENNFKPVYNYMAWSILLTIFNFCSCIGAVLGVVAIVYSSKVTTYLALGDIDNAHVASNVAKVLNIINSIILGSIVVYYVVFMQLGYVVLDYSTWLR